MGFLCIAAKYLNIKKGGANMCYVVQVAIYHSLNNVWHDRQYFNNYSDAKAHFDKLSEYLRTKQERAEIETWDMRISPYKGF